jgi:segregation and condensation protein B
MNIDKLKEIVEVLIFASDTSISVKQIQSIVDEAKPKEIEKAVEVLNNEYRQTGRSFTIVMIAGGYQMVSRESYSQWVRKLFHRKIKARLTQAALETLSVIAFKQPVSKPEMESIRGVNCDGVIHTLLERKLITLAGRAEGQGKPLLYKTTQEFLRYFGVNDINDLPKPREIEEILKEEKKPEDSGSLRPSEAVDRKKEETVPADGEEDRTGPTVEADGQNAAE